MFDLSVLGESDIAKDDGIEDLKLLLAHKKVWMASSIHKGEEEGRHLPNAKLFC